MPEAIYDKLSVELEEFIRRNGLRGRLPGVHKLAKFLGVNHITVRKAVELLVEKGRLEVIPSRGTFVVEKAKRARNHHVIGFVGVTATINARETLFSELNERYSSTGYRMMCLENNPQLFFENPRLLLQFPVDGYIFCGSSLNRRIMLALMEEGIPVISTINTNFPEINHVGSDHFEGYARALRVLRGHGCRRIAYLGYERLHDFRNYTDEIRDVFIAELGEDFDPGLFVVSEVRRHYARYGEAYHEIIAEEVWHAWRNHPPDGLVSIPEVFPVFLHHMPALKSAIFPLYGVRTRGDVVMTEDLPSLLEKASKRMLELLAGDTSVTEIRIPFLLESGRKLARVRQSFYFPAEAAHVL